MRIYCSIAYDEQFNAARYPWPLIAFPYDRTFRFFKRIKYAPESILTDSGAWSAWTLGEAISIDEYIDWSLRFKAASPCDVVHISLDVIPGSFKGKPPSQAERVEGAERSLANGDKMREAGLTIMEVFHQTEPVEFLDKLVERLRPGDVLGISPRKDFSSTKRHEFCGHVFRLLIDRYGRDKLPPAHGLGAFGRMIRDYPWWSVDTSSWVRGSKYGIVDQMQRGKARHEPRMRGNKPLREHTLLATLNGWHGWANSLTALWEERGVAHVPRPT